MPCTTNCRSEKQSSESCSQRSVTYQTWCRECKAEEEEKRNPESEKSDDGGENIPPQGKCDSDNPGGEVTLYTYIGESSRSAHERGFEHLRDAREFNPTSHILKHILDKHPSSKPEDVHFDMKIIRKHQSPFERQIFESVIIQKMREKHHLLNSRSEYNRCALPRLGLQLGDKEFKARSREEMEEKEKEEELARKIMELKKDQIKRRSNIK